MRFVRRCLDTHWDWGWNGAHVGLWDCHEGINQRWSTPAPPPVPPPPPPPPPPPSVPSVPSVPRWLSHPPALTLPPFPPLPLPPGWTVYRSKQAGQVGYHLLRVIAAR